MTAKGASADKPSDTGSTGLKWAAEVQHWVPLFNTIPEVPTLNLSRVPHNSCARLRQRLCRKHCRERDVVRCFESLNWLAGRRDCYSEHDESEPGATQFLFKQEAHARVRKLVHFSSCADESLTYGEEGTCLLALWSGHFEPESPSRGLSAEAVERHDKLALQDVAIAERGECGALGEFLSGQTRSRKDRSNATTSEEKASAHMCRNRRPLIANRTVAPSFLELHAVKNSDPHHQASQKFLQHTLSADILLVADAEVDESLVSYFNEKYRVRNSGWAGDILPGVVFHYFSEFGKH